MADIEKEKEALQKAKLEYDALMADVQFAIERSRSVLAQVDVKAIKEIKKVVKDSPLLPVAENMCILFEVKPIATKDPDDVTRMKRILDYWTPFLSCLIKDSKFYDVMKNYDIANIPDRVYVKAMERIDNLDFDSIQSACSAFTPLCYWIKAVCHASKGMRNERMLSLKRYIEKQELRLMAPDEAKTNIDILLEKPNESLDIAFAALNLGSAEINGMRQLKTKSEFAKYMAVVVKGFFILHDIKYEEESYWDEFKKLLASQFFITNMLTFDKENIPPERVDAVRKSCLERKDFNPKSISKKSKLMEAISLWIIAMVKYHDGWLATAALREKLSSKAALKAALKAGGNRWGRSKIMIVGEGRAGKTAVARSIVGKNYEETDSTLGIDQFTCSINDLSKGNGEWNELQREEEGNKKELESAVASLIAMATHGGDVSEDILASLQSRQISEEEITELPSVAVEATIPITDENSGDEGVELAIHEKSVPVPPSADAAEIEKAESEDSRGSEGKESLESQTAVPVLQSAMNPTEIAPTLQVDEEAVMKLLSEGAQTESDLLISVFDYGGQQVFDVIHNLFLTEYGVYALCFNCSWLLETASAERKNKCLSYLKKWLNSIVLHTYDVVTKHTAPILLIGTHCDVVSDFGEHHRISELLNDCFLANPAWKFKIENEHGTGRDGVRANLSFFPVDNVKGRKDPVFKDMMQRIENTMENAAYTRKKVPLEWLKCMDSLKAKKICYLSHADVSAIACEDGIKADDVDSFLLLLHNMGYLLWIDEPGLREVVIMDAIEYLVRPATLVVCNLRGSQEDDLTRHYLQVHKEANIKHEEEWVNLVKRGILQQKLLITLWRDYLPEKDNLLVLMIRFGLIVPLLSDADDSEIMEFVVPSLLPQAPVSMIDNWGNSSNSQFNGNTCYIVFTMKANFSKQNTIMQGDLHEFGFFPSGLYERILGGCIGWAQTCSTSGRLQLSDTGLFMNMAIIRFGNQMFRLIPLTHLNCMRVDIEGRNPIPVITRLMKIVDEVIAKGGFKSLHPFVNLQWRETLDTASQKGIQLISFEKSVSTESMLLPLKNIKQAAIDKTDLVCQGRRLMEKKMLLKEYDCWLAIDKPRSWYDCFLSYRWQGFDDTLVASVFDTMSNYSVGEDHRRIEIFMDKRRLRRGEKFDEEFIQALLNSAVVIPIVSVHSLTNMTEENFDPQSCDNVLLEWICTSEFINWPQSRIVMACPIMMGDITFSENGYTGKVGSLFTSETFKKLSSARPLRTIQKAKELLALHNITPSDKLELCTVKSFIDDFLKFNGVVKTGHSLTKLPSEITKEVHTVIEMALPKLEEKLQAQRVVHDHTGNSEIGDIYSGDVIENSALGRCNGSDAKMHSDMRVDDDQHNHGKSIANKLQVTSSQPSDSPDSGTMRVDCTNNILYVFNGTVWKKVDLKDV